MMPPLETRPMDSETMKKYPQKLRILFFILDDDPDNRELMENELKKAGFENYEIFDKIKDFLDALNDDVHLIALDHHFPEDPTITGFNVLLEAKARNPYVYSIIVSGQTDQYVTEDYMNAGANKYLNTNRYPIDWPQRFSTLLAGGLEFVKRNFDIATMLKQMEKGLTNVTGKI